MKTARVFHAHRAGPEATWFTGPGYYYAIPEQRFGPFETPFAAGHAAREAIVKAAETDKRYIELVTLLRRVDILLTGSGKRGDSGANFMNDFGHAEMDALEPLVRALLAKVDAP